MRTGLGGGNKGALELCNWRTVAAKAWSRAYRLARRRVTVSLSPEKAFHLLQRASVLSSDMKSSEPTAIRETCRRAP